jgi:MFS family permease
MNAERSAGLAQTLLLLAGSCLPVLGAVLLAPVLPSMQAHFADTPGASVLVIIALTLPALMIALLAPVAGILADRLGRRPLLLGAMLLYSVCGLLPIWLESLPAIVASRAGIGLAEAAIMTCCTALMGDYYSGARRERLFALQMVATSLSATLFIAVGGVLGEHGWRAPFGLYAVGLLMLPLMAYWLWEPQTATAAQSTSSVTHVFPWGRLAPAYFLAAMAGISLFVVPVQSSHLLNLMHIDSPQQIGMTMGANQLGVLLGSLAFPLLARTRAHYLMALAFILAGAGGWLMAVASTHVQLVIAVTINGLGVGMMIPTLLTWIMNQVTFSQRGHAAGGFTSAFFAGEFASPLIVLAIVEGAKVELATALLILASVQALVALACMAAGFTARRTLTN